MAKKLTLRSLKNSFNIKSPNNTESNYTGKSDIEFQINFVDLIKLIFLNKKLITSCVVLCMIITAAVIFILPNKYTSSASLLPSGNNDKFSTIKQFAGIGLGGFDADENSSVLFPTILKSNHIIDAVLDEKYTYIDNSEEKTQTYQEYLEIDIRDVARDKLRKQLDIGTNKKTGVITLSLETKYPQLSQALLIKFIDELDRYNIYKRRSSAKENVIYLTKELSQKEKELRDSEDSLESFQMANRNWAATSDPELLKALSRHRREVTAKLNTYIFLRKQYEISKLDVQKDIPIVSTLDSPSLPTIKSSPKRISSILLSGIVGFFLSMLLLIVTDAYRKYKMKNDIPIKIKNRNKNISHEVHV